MEPEPKRVEIDGEALLFGGPYGNLQATEAVLAEAARLRIPPERMICTGDLAAYCAEPAETIDLIRASGMHVVMGNCDEQLAASADDCGCGFAPGSACERASAAWFAHADAEVGGEARRWLAALPRGIDLRIGGARLAVIHGGAERTNEFIFASTSAALKRSQIERLGADGIIAGHCGLPFTQVLEGKLWHNPGVIGMPANDGTPRIWYSVLRPSGNGLTVMLRALDYNFEMAATKMYRAALPPDYAEALSTGLWPSCDILPDAEKRQRGRLLEPEPVLWGVD